MDIVGEHLLGQLVSGAPRCLGFVLLLPLPWGVLHVVSRVLLSLILALCIGVEGGANTAVALSGLLSELMIGALLSAPFFIAASAAEFCGECFDTGRGQSIGTQLDPFNYEASAAAALLLRWLIVVWVLTNGLIESSIEALGESFIAHQSFATPPSGIAELGKLFLNLLCLGAGAICELMVPVLIVFFSFEVAALYTSRFVAVSCHSEILFLLKALGGLMLAITWLQGEGITSVRDVFAALSTSVMRAFDG